MKPRTAGCSEIGVSFGSDAIIIPTILSLREDISSSGQFTLGNCALAAGVGALAGAALLDKAETVAFRRARKP